MPGVSKCLTRAAYVPTQATVKNILNIVVVIVLIIWILNSFGVVGPLNRPIR
jgi:hypothetical protein